MFISFDSGFTLFLVELVLKYSFFLTGTLTLAQQLSYLTSGNKIRAETEIKCIRAEPYSLQKEV